MKILLKTLTLFLSLASSVAAADAPATHGMLLFGQNQTYASHLPMFHKPHDYQLIMKIKLSTNPRASSMPLIDYKKAKQNGEKIFTLVPQKMDLTKLINGEKKFFYANIYQGHFEKGGNNLGWVKVEIEKIIFSQKLDPNAKPSSKFLAFGEKGEYYGAHIIGGKPNYDSIFSITQPKVQELNNGECYSRAGNCGPVNTVYVPDNALPQKIADLNLAYQAPEAGDYLIDLPLSTKIIEVIYSEYNDLSH